MKKILLCMMMAACMTLTAWAETQTYPDPLETGTTIYKLVSENEQARVMEVTFKPGEEIPMHTHPSPHFVYVLEGGQLTLTHPDGSIQVADGVPGQVIWMPAESHSAKNTGSTTFRALVTEIKTVSNAAGTGN